MRFFLSILGVIIFVVLVIVIIAHGGTKVPLAKPINLTSYNTPASSVTQITNGIVNSDSQRVAIKVTVTQSASTIYILNGYNQTIVSTETFSNNSASYGVFLSSLQNAGFTNSRKTLQTNMFGVCPLGSTYQYQLFNNTKPVSNLWSTSCNISDGTFNGQGQLIRQLFSLQIPNFRQFTNNINPNSVQLYYF